MIRTLLKEGGMILFNEEKRRVIIVTKSRMIKLNYDEFISKLREEFKTFNRDEHGLE